MKQKYKPIMHNAVEIKQMAIAAKELISLHGELNEYLKECKSLLVAIEDHGTGIIMAVDKL